MIVDMMRNDLGRIAERGSVQVASAFDVEKYPTVLQMTSTVAARSSAAAGRNPAGGVSAGVDHRRAEVRTMEIIRELEADPRGVYTGCDRLSFPRPQGAVQRGHSHRGDRPRGRGGGIRRGRRHRLGFRPRGRICRVRDEGRRADGGISRTSNCWKRCSTRASTATSCWKATSGRLAESAEYFAFAVDPAEVRRRLDESGRRFPRRRAPRAALRRPAGTRGGGSRRRCPPSRLSTPWRLRLAQRPIDRRNVFLYHKTTCRARLRSGLPGAR